MDVALLTPDAFGWLASALTLLTFLCTDMRRLRYAALGANVAFIGYGAMAQLWPVLALHMLLVPVNLRRLIQMRVAQRTAGPRPERIPTRPLRRTASTAVAALALVWPPSFALAQPLSQRLHAQAVESFRQGRFSEAYGRFVQLANAGHAPAAGTALWMCQHGLELFGRDWDCAPHEVDDWASLAGVVMLRPDMVASWPRALTSSAKVQRAQPTGDARSKPSLR